MAVDQHMTLAEFRVAHKEFCDVKDDVVKVALAHCVPRTDPQQLVDKLNQAHGLLTAHTLAASPAGQQARLVSKEGDTTYKQQFRELVRETIIGAELSGGAGNDVADSG